MDVKGSSIQATTINSKIVGLDIKLIPIHANSPDNLCLVGTALAYQLYALPLQTEIYSGP